MIEITLSNVPRKTPGFYMTRKHYHKHVISLSFYLHGYKLEFTVMEYRRPFISFRRYHNLT